MVAVVAQALRGDEEQAAKVVGKRLQILTRLFVVAKQS
jgi:hypothetical protein